MKLIDELKRDKRFFGECPHCSEEFPLSKAVLFSIKGPFPDAAKEKLELLRKSLIERREELRKEKQLMTTKAQTTTRSVNIGKIVEKIAPTFKGFSFAPKDCRALMEPIDYLVFNGLERRQRVDSISFVDVKSGKATLGGGQRAIKEAVSARRVRFSYCARGRRGV